ncbi:MAG: 2-oxoacid:acceptor oxidoreductase family protein, partial [Rhodobacteraceae bacterium]|nr:2-oxoacid:acceptor oxidoreductase family protein [Paracoccaceae bacterium]
LGQTLAVAAHADGYFASNLDITGLAQKYGAVHSHIKFAASTDQMRATRIATGEANALIGCDLVVAAGDEALSKLTPGQSWAVVDTTVVPTSEFSKNPDWQLSGEDQIARLTRVLDDHARALNAQDLAERIMGDRLFANMLLLGAAWQQGSIPLSLAAIHRAIALNGVAVAANRQAFDLGRLAFADPEGARRLARDDAPVDLSDLRAPTLDQAIARRVAELTDYRDAAFARRYADRVAAVRQALPEPAAAAVARGLYKLMAVKDEWEIARLYCKPAFAAALAESFDGEPELTFYFGAWPYGGTDPTTGKPVKGAVRGRKAMRFFRWMNRLRRLRGTPLDPFRNTAEARLAARLLAEYQADIDLALTHWSADRATALIELLDLPEHIRGYGPVRERHAEAAAKRRATLRAAITDTKEIAA